ncbi:MAG TPA: RNA 3'-terminal phosphate cyclase, partial [Gammaproteobacteria bacterium]|nr:RNA 3'-terminal phosphate cyclase [Gammaproteobacteria bacterium]
LRRLGVALELTLGRPGFYPRGGGLLRARLSPARRLRPLTLCERGALRRVTGVSAVAGLDRAIAARQHGAARDRLGARGIDCAIEEQVWHADSPGSVLALYGVFEAAEACFFALGVRGKPAERVGRQAADQLLDFLDGAAAVQAHLADQLLLPLALARGPSVLRTERVTSHLLTNAAVVRRFLPVGIDIPAPETVPAEVRIEPRSPG